MLSALEETNEEETGAKRGEHETEVRNLLKLALCRVKVNAHRLTFEREAVRLAKWTFSSEVIYMYYDNTVHVIAVFTSAIIIFCN